MAEKKVYSLNESDRQLRVVADNLGAPTGLALDHDSNKLYWGDAYFGV